MDIGGNTKKYLFYLIWLLLLLLINIVPVSAKENNMCVRSIDDLHVKENMITGSNNNAILSTPCVDEKEKVYDFADLLSDSEEEELYNTIQNFIEKTNYDLAVVTINENNKYSPTEYADDFYDYNNFGFNITRDGLLILIDMSSRDIWISTTGNALKMYDDSRCDSVYRYGASSATIGNYKESFSKMIEKLTEYYNSGFPESNENLNFDDNGNPYYIKHINYSLVALISFIITLVVSLIFYNTSKSKKNKNANSN